MSKPKGKVILLDFWSVTCRPCLQVMPKLAELYRQFEKDPQVAIPLVNNGWEPLAVAGSFAEKRSDHLPFASDENSKLFGSLGLEWKPSTILIDRRYRIALRHSGNSEPLLDELPRRNCPRLAKPASLGHPRQCDGSAGDSETVSSKSAAAVPRRLHARQGRDVVASTEAPTRQNR